MGTFLAFLANNIGVGFAVTLIILVLAIWGFIKVRDAQIKCIDHDNQIKGMVPEIKDIHNKIAETNTKVSEIGGSVKAIMNMLGQSTPLAVSHSPVTLNDKGLEIAKELDAESIFNKYSERLVNLVLEQGPITAYDIQTVSFNIAATKLLNMMELSEIEKMKNLAFVKGHILEHLWIIFGIYLRNKVLEIRGIPISEIDNRPS